MNHDHRPEKLPLEQLLDHPFLSSPGFPGCLASHSSAECTRPTPGSVMPRSTAATDATFLGPLLRLLARCMSRMKDLFLGKAASLFCWSGQNLDMGPWTGIRFAAETGPIIRQPCFSTTTIERDIRASELFRQRSMRSTWSPIDDTVLRSALD